MIPSYMAIASASVGLPEIMIVFVCPGGVWKTLHLCDLMGALWGTGRAVAPPSILQTVEEFRRQGHLYRGTKWISVDESKPAMGIEEDAFKIFVSCGGLCLRRNREAETRFVEWSRRGETWSMNPDDVPHVPSATESAYKRRLRCVVMRSKFSQDPDEVCPGSRIYLAGDTLKDWIRGPEATSVFWVTVLMPFIRSTSKSEFEFRMRRPPAQVAADTAWLLRKMARIGPPDTPSLSRGGFFSGGSYSRG